MSDVPFTLSSRLFTPNCDVQRPDSNSHDVQCDNWLHVAKEQIWALLTALRCAVKWSVQIRWHFQHMVSYLVDCFRGDFHPVLKKQNFRFCHHELFRGETAEHMLPADISTTIFHCNLLPHWEQIRSPAGHTRKETVQSHRQTARKKQWNSISVGEVKFVLLVKVHFKRVCASLNRKALVMCLHHSSSS